MMMDFPLDVSNTGSSVTCENECFSIKLIERKSNVSSCVFCFHLDMMNSIQEEEWFNCLRKRRIFAATSANEIRLVNFGYS